MGKTIINFISSYYSISGNENIDVFLFFITGLLAYTLAFKLVEIIFNKMGFYNSKLMSNCHWIIRIGVFVVITVVFKEIFKFIYWVTSFDWWVYLVIFTSVTSFAFAIYYLKKKKPERRVEENTNEGTRNENVEQLVQETRVVYNTSDYCPLCKSKLNRREGPYGHFWGCGNFPKCKYTRKYK